MIWSDSDRDEEVQNGVQFAMFCMVMYRFKNIYIITVLEKWLGQWLDTHAQVNNNDRCELLTGGFG